MHQRLVLVLWLLVLLPGCAGNRWITARRSPFNPLAQQLQLDSRRGPQVTGRTQQVLRRYDLARDLDSNPDRVLRTLMDLARREPTPDKVYAFAETAYVHALRADTAKQHSLALDLYAVSVAHAYEYLFSPAFDALRNPYDPQFRGACDLYNSALEGALRIVHKQGKLLPGEATEVETAGQRYDVSIVARGWWHAEQFSRLEFASDFEVTGLRNHYTTHGLGVPMIAVRRSRDSGQPLERFYPPDLSFPVTAFLRVVPGDAARGKRPHCVLELHDPLASTDIEVAGRLAPLESDLTTPLAYFLNNPQLQQNSLATAGLLRPGEAQGVKGLYMLEPYDPDRIPVLMVHGLWSSPLTWMPMFNDLRALPEIRKHYQFWFYMYPTGQPFWVSAAQLRADLEATRRTLDPERSNDRLDHMVLVGHSMGGFVSKMQVVESGNEFWKLVSDRPFEELKADPEIRDQLVRTLFFQPNRSIRRLITLGTPHRGSRFANDTTRALARRVIEIPTFLTDATSRLRRDNPDFFKNTDLLDISTSIDSLGPDSPVLPVLLAAPHPHTRHHNIIGVVQDGGIKERISRNGDGIVSFASAHLENADSEIVVNADHTHVHQHPLAVLEVRRILLENLAEYQGSPSYAAVEGVGTGELRAPEGVAPRAEPAMFAPPPASLPAPRNRPFPTVNPLLGEPAPVSPESLGRGFGEILPALVPPANSGAQLESTGIDSSPGMIRRLSEIPEANPFVDEAVRPASAELPLENAPAAESQLSPPAADLLPAPRMLPRSPLE